MWDNIAPYYHYVVVVILLLFYIFHVLNNSALILWPDVALNCSSVMQHFSVEETYL